MTFSAPVRVSTFLNEEAIITGGESREVVGPMDDIE